MRVTFLGTGTSTGVPVPTCRCDVCCSDDPRDRRLRPSVLLRWDEAAVLIDTATDLRQQVMRHSVERIDAVLYTHAHADHVLGLDDMRVYAWRLGGPVPIYGSPPTLEALARTFWYVFDDEAAGESTRPEVTPHTVDGPFALIGRTVIPVPLMHGSLSILGYRIGDFAYLTDASSIPETSHALLDGLDVLVLNALRERPHPTHLSIKQAVRQARRIGARRTYFTHLSHEVSHDGASAGLPDGIELAYDGLELETAGETDR